MEMRRHRTERSGNREQTVRGGGSPCAARRSRPGKAQGPRTKLHPTVAQKCGVPSLLLAFSLSPQGKWASRHVDFYMETFLKMGKAQASSVPVAADP